MYITIKNGDKFFNRGGDYSIGFTIKPLKRKLLNENKILEAKNYKINKVKRANILIINTIFEMLVYRKMLPSLDVLLRSLEDLGIDFELASYLRLKEETNKIIEDYRNELIELNNLIFNIVRDSVMRKVKIYKITILGNKIILSFKGEDSDIQKSETGE